MTDIVGMVGHQTGHHTSLVVVGSSNTDLIVEVGHIPLPGETLLGSDLRSAAGGKGANQAVAAARVGADVTFIGALGDDQFGDAAAATLAEAGVQLGYLRRISGVPSGVALITIVPTGENSIVVAPGANAYLTPTDCDTAAPAIRQANMVIAQYETPLAVTERAFMIARETGVMTLLNPAPARTDAASTQVLALTDILICNEIEAAALSGLAVDTADEATTAALALVTRGHQIVIITRGRAGCVAAQIGHAEIISVPAFEVTAVDSTAAGDAFTGSFAARFAGGDELIEALRYATATAALSVQRIGAQPSLPTDEEVNSFLKQQP